MEIETEIYLREADDEGVRSEFINFVINQQQYFVEFMTKGGYTIIKRSDSHVKF